MGKIEDMRRVREQRFAEQQARSAKSTTAATSGATAPAVEVEIVLPKPVAAERSAPKKMTSRATAAEQGKCPECGKTKPLQNGVMASHQKGFGKACPGSRKAPS